jgi:EpsI family protein
MSIRPQFVIAAALMFVTALLAAVGKPTIALSEKRVKINLATQIPREFKGWFIDKSIAPITPNAELQSRLDEIYTQTLSQTYRDASGNRVMLSIAYGSDQASEATAVHRPEFCYSAQGFSVRDRGISNVTLPSYNLGVNRLLAKLGPRNEPISYWITLDQTATLPGIGRKLQQLRYGIQGFIPDGMLVRVSVITNDEISGYKIQEDFLRDLYESMPVPVRDRYFGRAADSIGVKTGSL